MAEGEKRRDDCEAMGGKRSAVCWASPEYRRSVCSLSVSEKRTAVLSAAGAKRSKGQVGEADPSKSMWAAERYGGNLVSHYPPWVEALSQLWALYLLSSGVAKGQLAVHALVVDAAVDVS